MGSSDASAATTGTPEPLTLDQPLTRVEDLRALIGTPGAPALNKQIDHLDEHCRRFIALSPLLFIASTSEAGLCDVSPKGDAPGFVRVLDERRLAIPDRPGNRRADTLINILERPQVALLFVIPGMRETLRINGAAALYTDPTLLDTLTAQGKPPQLAIIVEAREVFLHCGRALIRSKLWETVSWPQPETLPSAPHIFTDHIALPGVTCEVAEESLEASYTTELY
ncbi:MAG TPA: pyridoxamine 5'-phosphate oxidase family protein [Ktedonobacterales bacterium]|nr:pyridoxamine 5'-phosphate oxidase family protein [Ktedonobacterales bacterium]